MLKKIWIAADCVISPLGYSTKENYENLRKGITGICKVEDETLSPTPFFASKFHDIASPDHFTLLEDITCRAVERVIADVDLILDKTVFILSTTKGNIAFLDKGIDHPRIHLHALASFIASKYGIKKSLVVSNACISGVMALLVGKRLIEAGESDHAVIVGVDVLSRFIVSGFQSLQALSSENCRPFDIDRKGLNLGECAAAMVITGKPEAINCDSGVSILGGGISNDANHISGPSRTGEELAYAISQALAESNIHASEIDLISAHGTATLYNDEMEAKAFTLQQMQHAPVNSLKGYFGHTLGAAGILEVVISTESLKHNELIPSKGYKTLGVSQPLNVISKLESRVLQTCLKTASGFGGCNAAIILRKETNN